MTNEEKEAICNFLESSALADHLGDVRDAERYLWEALGVTKSERRAANEATDYTDSAYSMLCHIAKNRTDLPFSDDTKRDDNG